MSTKGLQHMNAAPQFSALQHVLTEAQLRCLERIDRTRSRPPQRRKQTQGFRLAAGERRDSGTATSGETSPSGSTIWAYAVGFEVDRCSAVDVPDEAQVIGSVSLWPILEEDFSWIDLACVASDPVTRQRQLLPIELAEVELDTSVEVDAPVDIESVRHALVLKKPVSFSVAQLQEALADDDRCRWAYEYDGPGVFVVVLLDLVGAP